MERYPGVLLVLASLAAGAAQAQAGVPFAADRDGWQTACRTYENRARFLPREGDVAFVTVVAEACAGALASLDSGRPEERDAAARLLTRVAAFRQTILTMNVERVYGKDPEPRAKPKEPRRRMGRVATVSQTGEYLIAYRMGVVTALRRWIDTGAPFSLAQR